MLETEEASDSHDEEIRGPVSGLCHRRLSGNRPHGWDMESSALGWKAVGGGSLIKIKDNGNSKADS